MGRKDNLKKICIEETELMKLMKAKEKRIIVNSNANEMDADSRLIGTAGRKKGI